MVLSCFIPLSLSAHSQEILRTELAAWHSGFGQEGWRQEWQSFPNLFLSLCLSASYSLWPHFLLSLSRNLTVSDSYFLIIVLYSSQILWIKQRIKTFSLTSCYLVVVGSFTPAKIWLKCKWVTMTCPPTQVFSVIMADPSQLKWHWAMLKTGYQIP